MENLKKLYSKKKKEIKARLKEFSTNKDIFYELCFCILTPQSNAIKCDQCVKILKSKNFLNININPEPFLAKKTRFHKNKSKYLLELKKKFKELSFKEKDGKKLRNYLVKNLKGLGYKETSHFLRNIGYKNLAILDRHILKNLKTYKVIKTIPQTLTKKKYLEIENKFLKFSKKSKIPMDELDLLFWYKETGKIFK